MWFTYVCKSAYTSLVIVVVAVVVICVELIDNTNDTQLYRHEIVVNASVTLKDTNHISYKCLFLALPFYDPLWKRETLDEIRPIT